MEEPRLQLTARPVLVTGAAGFIGFHVACRLLRSGVSVVGLDIVNDYYDTRLKEARLVAIEAEAAAAAAEESRSPPFWVFSRTDLCDKQAMESLFLEHKFEVVVHLAAQAGVRYSLTNPAAYMQSNMIGFSNILELCRHNAVKHLVYASSSSVYGGNTTTPFSEAHSVDHPVSLYAASKKSNELMAHSYSHLFQLPTTGLRFFTVYGPWGRPDMAVAIFTKQILEGKPIELFNEGQMLRDFTYVDDIVEGVLRVAERPPVPNPGWDAAHPDPSTSSAPYRVFNIGNSDPVPLLSMVTQLEKVIGREAVKIMKPMQPGDVLVTSADVSRLHAVCGFAPRTPLSDGLAKYVSWYQMYTAAKPAAVSTTA